MRNCWGAHTRVCSCDRGTHTHTHTHTCVHRVIGEKECPSTSLGPPASLLGPALPSLALPYSAPPCPAPPYLILPCPTLPHPALPCLTTWPCPPLPHAALSCAALVCPTLACPCPCRVPGRVVEALQVRPDVRHPQPLLPAQRQLTDGGVRAEDVRLPGQGGR